MLSNGDIVGLLNELGMNNVVSKFEKYTEKKKSEIPPFYTKKSESARKLRNILFDLQKESLHITQDELQSIENGIKTEKSDADSSEQIIQELKKLIPEEKHVIFSDEIISTYTNDKSKFNSTQYLNFIDWYNEQLENIAHINSIEEIDCSQCISSKCLQQFIIEKTKTFKTAYPKDVDPEWTKNTYSVYVLYRILFELQLNEETKIYVPHLFKSRSFTEFIDLDKSDISSISYKDVANLEEQFFKIAEQETKTVKKDNMKEIYSFRFSDLFIDRLYEYIDTINGEATFLGFIQFYIPLRFLHEYPHAVNFFFGILDVDEDGILSRDDIYYFYKAQILEADHTEPSFDLFYSRLLDRCTIKAEEMSSTNIMYSESAREIITILIDVQTFEDTYSIPTAANYDFDDDEEYEEEDDIDF